MKVLAKDTLGEVVSRNFYSSEIFDSYGIDYCCEGGLSVEEICKVKNIEVDIILNALKDLPNQEDEASIPFSEWPLDLLIDYIEKKHHRYVDFNIPELSGLLEKVIALYGEGSPELKKVEKLFKEIAGELAVHMKKEELMIFPYIRKLVLLELHHKKIEKHPPFGNLENIIGGMLEDHRNEGDKFDEISDLTQGYKAPPELKNLLKKLEEFERDLHRHIHLENNILFPKAIELEQTLE